MPKIEDLDEKYKRLVQRADEIQKNKTRIEAERDSRKRNLKAQMEAARKEGHNPDTLREDIHKSEEVLAIKLDNYEIELDEAERVMKPMLEEVLKG